MTTVMAVTYFEDTALDHVVTSPAITLTAAHVSLYSGLTGDARDDPTLVPDGLPICVSTGLGWRVDRPPLAVMAFMSLEWQPIRTLRVGDTIYGHSRVATRRAMREGGVVIEEHELIDQRGEVVARGRFTFLVARRPV